MCEPCRVQPFMCTDSPKREQLEGCSWHVTSSYFDGNDLEKNSKEEI